MNAPIKPQESDCCNSGCNPCIFSVYEEQMKKFLKGINNYKPQYNCINQSSYSVFKLTNIEKHTKNCNLYTFEYTRPKNEKNIKDNNTFSIIYNPGQHLLLKADLKDDYFTRAYTPIFIENQKALQFTVVIKLYPNGKMSKYLQTLTIGSETLWRGPYGDFEINFDWKNIIFIAQGTGIAPFYSIICAILNNEDCYTKLNLWYCCDSENVIFRAELFDFAHFWNFKYVLFINNAKKEEFLTKYKEPINFSRLDIAFISENIKEVENNSPVLVCGSELFCDTICDILHKCNLDSNNIFVLK